MRRITLELMVGLETEADAPLDSLADQLVEEIRMVVPQLSVYSPGVPSSEWLEAKVTAVRIARLDEQVQEKAA
jgi:hypothetical protein